MAKKKKKKEEEKKKAQRVQEKKDGMESRHFLSVVRSAVSSP